MKLIQRAIPFLFAIGLFPSPAWSAPHPCFPDGDGPQSMRQAIDEASAIVLARAESATELLFDRGDLYDVNFEVIETIKGHQDKSFKQKGTIIVGTDEHDHGDFSSHTRMSFWDRLETRNSSSQKCEGNIGFEPHATYLIFDPGFKTDLSPLSLKYEKIETLENDLWLTAVRDMVADPEKAAPQSMDVIDYLRKQQSVVLILVESCSEKLRPSAHYIADVAEPLVGEAVTRDHLHPDMFSEALTGCNGLTTLLGIFYPPDPQAFETYDVNRLPQQVFVPVKNGAVDFASLRTEIEITGAQQVTLEELVAILRAPTP